MREKAKLLKIDPEMLKRPLNVGFSGGEKKRNEILQMALLEPSLCVLDETDSGLDIDAMRIVADGVNALQRVPTARCWSSPTTSGCSNYIVPDRVHVLSDGRVARSGGPELALELEETGYAEFGGQGRLRGIATWSCPSSSSGPRPSRLISTCSRRPRRRFPARATIRVGLAAPRPSRPMAASACRIAASRPGNTPTCAPG